MQLLQKSIRVSQDMRKTPAKMRQTNPELYDMQGKVTQQ